MMRDEKESKLKQNKKKKQSRALTEVFKHININYRGELLANR